MRDGQVVRTRAFRRRIIEAGQAPPGRFRQLPEHRPRQFVVAIRAVIHEGAHHVAHRHLMAEGGFAELGAAGAKARAGGGGVLLQRRMVLRGEAGLVQGGGDVRLQDGQVRHLRAEGRDVRIFPDGLELGLLLGESALDEMTAQLQVRLGLRRDRAFALGLHRGQADAGLGGGVHRCLHRIGLHETEVVFEHDAVNPAELGGLL